MADVTHDNSQKQNSKSPPVSAKQESTPQSGPSLDTPYEEILRLQRSIGNRAVGQLLKSIPIQAKLSVSQADDDHEREAEHIADMVMRMPSSTQSTPPLTPLAMRISPLSRAVHLQSRTTAADMPTVPSALAADIGALKGKGEPLSQSERSFFEPRFGSDFSQVRIHNDPSATRLAQSLNAKAFTLGTDVVMGNKHSRMNRHLLAHELTHVIQQSDGQTIFRTQTQVQSRTFRPPEDVTLDALRTAGVMIEVPGVAEMIVYQVHDQNYGGRWGRISFTFGSGQQLWFDIRGFMLFSIRHGNGAWSPELNLSQPPLQNPILRIRPSGELEIEGIPHQVDVFSITTGPVIYRYHLVSGRWQQHVTDFSTRQQRRNRVAEGAQMLQSGNLAGLDLILRAFAERIQHDRLNQGAMNDPQGTVRQLYLAEEMGEVVGRAVAHLFTGGNRPVALNVQTAMLNRLYDSNSPFTTQEAQWTILNSYLNILLQQALQNNAALAIQLLPAMNAQLAPTFAYAFLDHTGHQRLRQIAEAQLRAGNRAGALALFRFGAGTLTSGETQLLPGRVQGDMYVVATPGGDISMPLTMDGVRREFEGLPTPDSGVARMRAEQIDFSTQWQARARRLGVFTAQELSAVPPPPEIMQRYFTARYNGQMPGQFSTLRSELSEYMAVAFLHTIIDVPDALRIWNSQQLPSSADNRWAGDCGVMTRAVLHMLQGVAGLQFVPVKSEGHVRLLVLTASGTEGLLESNQYVHALEPGRNLEQRVRNTIARHADLQVLHNMPAPFSLGTRISSATAQDIDQAYEASYQTAVGLLPSVDPALSTIGQQLRPIIYRYDDYRVRRDRFFRDWTNDYLDATPTEQQALQRRRQTLAGQQQQLETDLNAVTTSSRQMQRFIREMRNMIQDGSDFLHGRDPSPPSIPTVLPRR